MAKRFIKGLFKDTAHIDQPEGTWRYAKNAIVRVPDTMIADLKAEAVAIRSLGMVPLKRLKKFTSKLSWVANLLSRMRWLC